MTKNNLIEMVIDEDQDGVFAISFVKDPAIESNFITLSKEGIKLSLQEDKRIATGAILIPDKPILRMSEDKEPYHIFFSKDTVEQVSQNI